MLAKKYRLNLSNEENSSMFGKDNALLLSSKNFLAYLRKNKTGLKVACIAPKNAVRLAFKRNFYRRILFSFVEEAMGESRLKKDSKIDLIIVLKRNFNKSKNDLKEDFSTLVDKIHENL